MAFPVIKPDGGGVATSVIAPNLSQFTRGNPAMFEVEFFDDAPVNTVPTVPASSASPAWVLVGPNGAQVAVGTGSPGSNIGRWQFVYNMPPDAALSTQSNKWRVIWTMTSGTGRQTQKEVPFDVIELRTPDTLEDLRGHAYLVYPGDSERLLLRLPKRVQDSMSCRVYKTNDFGNPAPQADVFYEATLGNGITLVEEQNLFTYLVDTIPLDSAGEYHIVWKYRYTMTSPSEVVTQKAFAPLPIFFSLEKTLRVLIDKLQKKSGTIHAYNSADIYEYFMLGIGYLNSVTPITSYSFCNFPMSSMTVRFLVEAAALVALQAQHLVAGELQFSFSGQSVTLDLDQTGIYGEVVQRLQDQITGDGKAAWPAAKVGLNRQLSPNAIVGGRMMGHRQKTFTYKVMSTHVGANQTPLMGTYDGQGPAGLGYTLSEVMLGLGI